MIHASPPPRVDIYTAHGTLTLSSAVSCTSSRAIANPVAQASVVFMGERIDAPTQPAFHDKRWEDVLNLYDLAKVTWPSRDGKKWQDGLYLVQRPMTARATTDAGPTEQTTLSLLSIGEALQRYKIFWNPWLDNRTNFAGLGFLARSQGKVIRGRPDEVIQSLLDVFLNDSYVFRFADGKKLKEKFALVFEQITDSLNANGLSALNAEGALWETLKRYADQPWNELFVDIPHETTESEVSRLGLDNPQSIFAGLGRYGETEAVYLRPTPFDPDRWASLGIEYGWNFEYDGSDRLDEQLGLDADTVANFFWASPKVVFSQFDVIQTIRKQSGNRVPIAFEDSIRRFGLRKMECGTEYVHANGKGQPLTPQQRSEGKTTAGSEVELIIRRTQQLARWFGYPRFYTGTLTTVGRIGANPLSGARVGGVLKNRKDGREYYIEQVSQSWAQGGTWTTTLNLTRGHKPAEYAAWRKEHGL